MIVIDPTDAQPRLELENGNTNVVAFDIFTIPHVAMGYVAASSGVPLAAALWIALAVEAAEIGLSAAWPDLMKNATRESRANQLGDLAAFLAAYQLGRKE